MTALLQLKLYGIYRNVVYKYCIKSVVIIIDKSKTMKTIAHDEVIQHPFRKVTW